MDNASRGLEAREIPEKHLETMLVGKDLRTQLDELVVAYGEESLKLNPDEAFMSNLASRMNEVGEKLKAFEGSSESAIHNYNIEAKSGADEARLNDLAEEVDRHEQLDTLGQAEAVARYGAVAVAHGENTPVLEHLGQNIDNMTRSVESGEDSPTGETVEPILEPVPVLAPDTVEPVSVAGNELESSSGPDVSVPSPDIEPVEPVTEPAPDVDDGRVSDSENEPIVIEPNSEGEVEPTEPAEPVTEPAPEASIPTVNDAEGDPKIDISDVVLEGKVLDPVKQESPEVNNEGDTGPEPVIVEGEVVDDRDDDNPESSSEPESGPEPSSESSLETEPPVAEPELDVKPSSGVVSKPLPEIEPGPKARLELGPSPEDLSGESTDDVEAPVDEVEIDPVPVEGNGEDSPERFVEFTDNPFRLATAEAKQPYERDQDVTLRDDRNGLYGVFDGMGSADDSRRVAETVAHVLQERSGEVEDSHDAESVKRWIEECLGQAHNETVDIDGATTASVVKVITDNEGERRAVWASVGDSRIYIASNEGAVRRITRDEGGLDAGQPGHTINNVIGVRDRYEFRQTGDVVLNPGDRLLIVSNGITGDKEEELLNDQEIADAVNGKTAEDAARSLIDISRKYDDKSVVVVDVLSDAKESGLPEFSDADLKESDNEPISEKFLRWAGGMAEMSPDPETKPAIAEAKEAIGRAKEVISTIRQVGSEQIGKYAERVRRGIGARAPIEDIIDGVADPVTKKTIPRPVRSDETPRARRKEGSEPSGGVGDDLRPDLSRSPLGYEAEVLAGKVADGLYRAKSWVGVGDKLSQPENGPIAQDSEIVETPVEEVIEVADSKPEKPLTVSEKALKELREAEKRLADFNEMAENGPKNDPEVTRAKDEMRRVLENHLSQAQRRYGQTRYLYGGDIEDGLDIPDWVNGGGVTERDEAIVEERRESDRVEVAGVEFSGEKADPLFLKWWNEQQDAGDETATPYEVEISRDGQAAKIVFELLPGLSDKGKDLEVRLRSDIPDLKDGGDGSDDIIAPLIEVRPRVWIDGDALGAPEVRRWLIENNVVQPQELGPDQSSVAKSIGADEAYETLPVKKA